MSGTKIVALVTIKPEYAETLIARSKELMKASCTEAGNISYSLRQEIGNPNHFVFVENWRSQAAIDERNAGEHFRGFIKATNSKTGNLEIALMDELSV